MSKAPEFLELHSWKQNVCATTCTTCHDSLYLRSFCSALIKVEAERERWDEEKQVRHGSAIRCLDRLAERPVLNFLPSLCVGFKGIGCGLE